MKFKLYIGEEITTTEVTKDIKLNFDYSEGTDGTVVFKIGYYSSLPFTGTPTYYSISLNSTLGTSAEMAETVADLIDIYIPIADVVYNTGDTFVTFSTTNDSPITIEITSQSGDQFFTYDNPVVIESIIVNYEPIDLFKDETINLTSKLSDTDKLANVFMDLTNSFSVPCSANNDRLFKHYYDFNIADDYQFNANIRKLALIEIDNLPLRYGKIELTEVDYPSNYKITFYGGTIQLSDLFGEDTLSRLDYLKTINGEVKVLNNLSKYEYQYNKSNFLQSLTGSTGTDFVNADIITPMISYTNRDWNYGGSNTIDISYSTGRVTDMELRPAFRVIRLIEAIEDKYGIYFTRDFFGKAMFNNLYMWCNSTNIGGGESGIVTYPVELTTFTQNDPSLYYSNVSNFDNYFSFTDNAYNYAVGNKYNISVYMYGATERDGSSIVGKNISFDIYDEDDNLILSETKQWPPSNVSLSFNLFIPQQETTPKDYRYRFQFKSDTDLLYTSTLLIFSNNFGTGPYDTVIITGESNLILSLERVLPKMKVKEFLEGLFKQFKLVIRPLSSKVFYVDTLNNYYENGNILDITKYADISKMPMQKPTIYKTIKFLYQKTSNVLGDKFRKLNDEFNNEIGYGDLKATYPAVESKDELKIELPFENMLFERMSNIATGALTNIIIGQSISTSDGGSTFSKNDSKPILFFNNGLVDITVNPFLLSFGNEANVSIKSIWNIGNTNDMILSQVTDTINFGAEIDPWHNKVVSNSLYLNYWEDWINTIYDIKQRKLSLVAYLPTRFIQELSLNDRLIIGSNRYKINDYDINLLDGQTKLNLFVDVFDPLYIEQTANNGLFSGTIAPYFVDYHQDGNNVWLYGDFDYYNNGINDRLIKLDKFGNKVDMFNVITGTTGTIYSFSTLLNDGDYSYISGDFTSYSGISTNRLAKINSSTGELIQSFTTNIGTGFNNFTSPIVKSKKDDKIFVGGLFSTVNGSTENRIVRLNLDGTTDITFSGTGTGFNNTVVDGAATSDGGIILTTYATTFNGGAINRIIKLNENGSKDTSFTGTLNSSGSTNQDGIIPSSDNSFFVFGSFTQYSGLSYNRIVRINEDSSIPSDFSLNVGFNGKVEFAKELSNGRGLFQSPYRLSGYFTSYENNYCDAVIINSNGTIYRTFSNGAGFYFNIDNIFYFIDNTTHTLQLISDETNEMLSTYDIQTSAGPKYYGIDVLKNVNWSVSKVNTGDGISWVDVLTESGDVSSEVLIKFDMNGGAKRSMDLLFQFDDHYRTVRLTQNSR